MEKNIDHLIAPDGLHLREGVQLGQREYIEAAKRGVRSASGQNLKLTEPIFNPTAARVLRLQAPAELQDAVEQTQTRLKESRELANKLFGAWIESKRRKQKFTAAYGDSLTDEGAARLAEFDREIQDLENDLRIAEEWESSTQVEAMHADQVLDQWIKDQRRAIEAGAAQVIVESATEDRSLAARLKRLKEKIAG